MQDPAPTSSTSTVPGSNEDKVGSTRDRPKRASLTKRSDICSFGRNSEQNLTRSATDRAQDAAQIFKSVIQRHASTPSYDPRYLVGPTYLPSPLVSIDALSSSQEGLRHQLLT